MNATTPVCRSCGTKFPGRESCKSCGNDPDATPSLAVLAEVAVASLDPSGDRNLDRRRRKALERSMMQRRKPRKHGRHSF